MVIFDKRFRENKAQYILQCLLATTVIFIVITTLNTLSRPAIIASLGATSFIAFAIPESKASKPRCIIGGYIVGLTTGFLFNLLHSLLLSGYLYNSGFSFAAFAALATGTAIFIMSVTNTEHPPAAGAALGFVMNEYNLLTAVLILAGVISISLIKELLGSRIKNLV